MENSVKVVKTIKQKRAERLDRKTRGESGPEFTPPVIPEDRKTEARQIRNKAKRLRKARRA